MHTLWLLDCTIAISLINILEKFFEERRSFKLHSINKVKMAYMVKWKQKENKRKVNDQAWNASSQG